MKRICCAAFFLLLLSPGLLEFASDFVSVRLGGVEERASLPSPNWKRFLEGAFQERFERWLKRTLTARRLLIKTDNELNVRLFGQLSSSPGGKAFLGENGELFESAYLKPALGFRASRRLGIEKRIRELTRLSKLLKQDGVVLAVIVSPNKLWYRRESLPWSYRYGADFSTLPNERRSFVQPLQEAGVLVLDAVELFQSLPEEVQPWLFAKTGTHWSEFGSCLAAKSLLHLLQQESGADLGELRCELQSVSTPHSIDTDLLSVANLWFPSQLLSEVKRPNRSSSRAGSAVAAHFVGSSFVWALFYNLEAIEPFSPREFYYYFRRLFRDPGGVQRKIARRDPKWLSRVMESKIVVIEVNESFLHRAGYRFPKRMLVYLKDLQGKEVAG